MCRASLIAIHSYEVKGKANFAIHKEIKIKGLQYTSNAESAVFMTILWYLHGAINKLWLHTTGSQACMPTYVLSHSDKTHACSKIDSY